MNSDEQCSQQRKQILQIDEATVAEAEMQQSQSKGVPEVMFTIQKYDLNVPYTSNFYQQDFSERGVFSNRQFS